MEVQQSSHNNVIDLNRQLYSKMYHPVMQAMNSYWMGVIPTAPYMLLLFIIGRTLRFAKSRERIPYRHMLEGVNSGGQQIQCGVGISRRSIFYATDWLEQCGFVDIERTKSSTLGYTANLFEINFKLILGCNMAGLPVPKPKKPKNLPMCKLAPSPCANGTQGMCKTDTQNLGKVKKLKDKKHKEPGAVAPRASVDMDAQRTIEAVTEKHRANRRKVEGVTPATMTSRSVTRMWQATMLEYWPKVHVIPVRNKKVFGMFQSTAIANLGADADLPKFFDWLIPAWPYLRGNDLAYLNKRREVMGLCPDFGILTGFFRAFARVYATETMRDEVDAKRVDEKRDKEIELELQAARAIIEQQADEKRELERKLAVVQRDKAARGPVSPGRPMTRAALEEAARSYDEDPNIGDWDD